MKSRLALLLLLVISSINYVACYNVLMMLPFASRSHKNVFDPVAEELVRRGHKVTSMAPFKDTKEQPGVTNVHLEEAEEVFKRHAISFFKGTPADTRMIKTMLALNSDLCNATYRDPTVVELLNNPRDAKGHPKYDLVVIDSVFGEFALPIAHHLGVPSMYLSPSHIFIYHAWSLDIPFPLSYVPVGVSFRSSQMPFVERAVNAFQALAFSLVRRFFLMPMQQRIIQEFLPQTPSLMELERNVSFILSNTHPALHKAAPRMPYTVDIGGVHCKPAKPLPKDLEEYMTSSGDKGVIYFSLGSYTKGESMPEDMKKKLLEAFSKVPQLVLWKYESPLEDLPPNVRLTSWAPQQDLLGKLSNVSLHLLKCKLLTISVSFEAHPKLRLFITHGGGLSTQEAAYHGCPILGFPLSADQWGNVAHAVHAGFSEFVDWKTFTSQELLEKIQTMISDPRYKQRALEMSKLYQDRLQHPAETAAYWMEYVIRHKGAAHLKSSAGHLNFFQYFLLDVIGALLLILFSIGLLLCWVIHKLRARCCPRPKKLKLN